MKIKKIPMRTCVITREKLPKKELIRVVKTKEGQVMVDESGKMNGRGAYLKKDASVFDKAKQSKALERHLEISIPDEIFNQLKSLL